MANKRLTVLEWYASKGFLDFVNRRFKEHTSEMRVDAGHRLYTDWYMAHKSVGAINYEKDKVDCSIKPESPKQLEAQERFNRAMRAIPKDFRSMVFQVAVQNRQIFENPELSRWDKQAQKKVNTILLCMGLDNLISHYNRKNK